MLELRPANATDALRLFEWANDPMVRAQAFNPEPIAWKGHQAWLVRKLASPGTRMFIAEAAGKPIGQIRFDIEQEPDGPIAHIDFSVGDGERGKGYGRALLHAGVNSFFFHVGSADAVLGITLPHNAASQRAFLAAGFSAYGIRQLHGMACPAFIFRRA